MSLSPPAPLRSGLPYTTTAVGFRDGTQLLPLLLLMAPMPAPPLAMMQQAGQGWMGRWLQCGQRAHRARSVRPTCRVDTPIVCRWRDICCGVGCVDLRVTVPPFACSNLLWCMARRQLVVGLALHGKPASNSVVEHGYVFAAMA